MKYYYFKSLVGTLQIGIEGEKIYTINFSDNEEGQKENWPDNNLSRECARQLTAYFEGNLHEFSLPLCVVGTDFQKRVWQQLIQIPYGTTISYFDLAVKLGNPKCIRAVGTANGRNPLPIVIPCHRVIGKDGSLTGYGGGLWRKEVLLNLERKFSGKSQPSKSQLQLF